MGIGFKSFLSREEKWLGMYKKQCVSFESWEQVHPNRLLKNEGYRALLSKDLSWGSTKLEIPCQIVWILLFFLSLSAVVFCGDRNFHWCELEVVCVPWCCGLNPVVFGELSCKYNFWTTFSGYSRVKYAYVDNNRAILGGFSSYFRNMSPFFWYFP